MPAYKSQQSLVHEIKQQELQAYKSLNASSQALEASFDPLKFNPISQQQLHQAIRFNQVDLGYSPVVGTGLHRPNRAMYTSSTNPLRGARMMHNHTVDVKTGLVSALKRVNRGSGNETSEAERDSNFDQTITTAARLSPSYLNRTGHRSKMRLGKHLVNQSVEVNRTTHQPLL